MSYYLGQRLSFKGQICTVRYIGSVAGKPGEWLGVEWDDPSRGKHDGTHDGTKYFECRNPVLTTASFLKPSQTWDKPRTFLQALREKYMPEDAGTGGDIVYFSSKKAEEIGFEKFARRQAQLQGIHTIVLDHMRIRGSADQDELEAVKQICGHVTELDLSGNLFESLQEVLNLAALLPKLSVLTIDSNRFAVNTETPQASSLPDIRSMSLTNTYLTWPEIALVTKSFPNIVNLAASHNGLRKLSAEQLPRSLKSLVLSENDFTALSTLQGLKTCSQLETIVLKRCHIKDIWEESAAIPTNPVNETVLSLDLTNNDITSWSFCNHLEKSFIHIKHLHVAGNPLYKCLKSAEGKPLTSEDGYMLTIARLPQLETLNYSKISDKERLNAETYYLGQIAAELSRVSESERGKVLENHPRWTELCEEYGEPAIKQDAKENEFDTTSLAARLLTITFDLAPEAFMHVVERSWRKDIPKSFNIYALLGIVGKKLNTAPLGLRLIWETSERDPKGRGDGHDGPEWWDSDEEGDAAEATPGDFVAREVLLVAGTKPLGTYIEGREARVRIEVNE